MSKYLDISFNVTVAKRKGVIKGSKGSVQYLDIYIVGRLTTLINCKETHKLMGRGIHIKNIEMSHQERKYRRKSFKIHVELFFH